MAPTAITSTEVDIPEFVKGVKILADAGVKVLPSVYVRPQGQRPADSPVGDEDLPIIDMSKPREELVSMTREACTNWGSFQVVNHGIPNEVIDNMFMSVNEFHALPIEEKMKHYSEDPLAKTRYGTSFNAKDDEVLNWRDFVRHVCTPFPEMLDYLPENPPSYRSSFEQYSISVSELGHLIIELISESLGLGPDYIQKTLGKSEFLTSNFYPPCPQPELALGLSPHSDPGILTLLQQDGVGGLQVSHEGKWMNVKPIPYAFIANIADQIQFLSNDRYKSIEHRALINNAAQRISIPYVFAPEWDKEVRPAPQILEEDKTAPLYKPIVYSEYVRSVLGGTLDTKREYLRNLRNL